MVLRPPFAAAAGLALDLLGPGQEVVADGRERIVVGHVLVGWHLRLGRARRRRVLGETVEHVFGGFERRRGCALGGGSGLGRGFVGAGVDLRLLLVVVGLVVGVAIVT